MRQRRCRNRLVLIPVRHPPMVLFPSHLASVADQVFAADVVVLAELGPAQAGEE